jgi:Zn-finger nucleic acid-binding protein
MQVVENKDYLRCEYCTYQYMPKPNSDGVVVLEEPTFLGCPVCQVQLVTAALNGNQIWSCTRCRGMLLPMSLFADTIYYERRRRSRQPVKVPAVDVQKELQRKLLCPQCANPMHTHPYAGPGNVVIDNCPRCRLNWLDYKELHRIVTAPERVFKDENWLPSWLEPFEGESEENH